MRTIGMIFLLATSIPLLAGDSAGTEKANFSLSCCQGGPPIAKRDFSEAEIESTLQALGIAPGSASNAISCDVEDSHGIVTNTVQAANYPLAPVYWLRYQPGTTFTKNVRFVVSPLFSGSPLASKVQVFRPHSTFEVLTPFGIPFWQNGLTSGPWVLVVQNDSGQSASFFFTVQ